MDTNNTAVKRRTFCLALYGESFRSLHHGPRAIGRPESFEYQIHAAKQHVEFAKHIRDAYDMDCEVMISTMSTPFDGDLLKEYTQGGLLPVASVTFHTTYPSNCTNSLAKAIFVALADQQPAKHYAFVVFVRIDLMLKRYMWDAKVFPTLSVPDKIYFSSVIFTLNNYHIQDKCCPRINPIITIFPARLMHILWDPYFVFEHESWQVLVHYFELNPVRDMGFLLDTLHDSDSLKDWNPLYKMTGRPETNTWHTEGFVYDQVSNTVEPVDNKHVYDALRQGGDLLVSQTR